MKTLIFWLVVVFVLSVYPLKKSATSLPQADKILHFIIYAVTTLLFYTVLVQSRVAAFKRGRTLPLALAVLLSLSYGLLMEVAQGRLTSTRHFSGWDAASNSLGAAAGAIYLLIRTRRAKP